MADLLNKYLTDFSTEQDPVLGWLQKQTNLRTNHARMLCGPVEGKLMEFISRMVAPMAILELGAFTGYSAICLARGLREGGVLDSLELNDELEDLILEAHQKAGLQDKIKLHIGDAKQTIEELRAQGKMYDLVFILAAPRSVCSAHCWSPRNSSANLSWLARATRCSRFSKSRKPCHGRPYMTSSACATTCP